ncbi:MAG: tyrosine-type recombinase/integrase [Alphaproteobacteria bacterium]
MNQNKNSLTEFEKSLIRQDMADHTIQGYLYDLHTFKVWVKDFYQTEIDLSQVTSSDIRAYRDYLIKIKRYKVASTNRSIQAIKRFYAWLSLSTNSKEEHAAKNIRFMRRNKQTKPTVLTNKEVNDLLRVAGKSPHGLAKRNYALVQLFLQSGIRVGEVVQLQIRDLLIQERSGHLKVVDGKGHKSRVIPLNAAVRRALNSYLNTRDNLKPEDHLIFSKRGSPQTIRGLQKIIQALVQRANITRIAASAHTLRHTFAMNYLKANPSALVALSTLLGHDSLDTTAIYTQSSMEDLSDSIERSDLNFMEEE